MPWDQLPALGTANLFTPAQIASLGSITTPCRRVFPTGLRPTREEVSNFLVGLLRNTSSDSSRRRTLGTPVNQLAQTSTFSKKLAPSSLTATLVVHHSTTTPQVATIIRDAKIAAHLTNLQPIVAATIIRKEVEATVPPKNLEIIIDRTLEEEERVPIITTHLISSLMLRTAAAIPILVPTQARGLAASKGEVLGTVVIPNTRAHPLST